VFVLSLSLDIIDYCNTAGVGPAATAPPFATAAADIIPAAYDQAVNPAAAKPAATTVPPRNG
jgi:hypothetical protein